jgi:predicted DNA binding CopG/RHH family protein
MPKKISRTSKKAPIKKMGRPKSTTPIKKVIAIRIAPGLLSALRALAAKSKKPYQVLIHEILERAVSGAL